MSVASKSPPSPAVDLSEKDRINGELDKIFLSARLAGVGVAFMPDASGRREGLDARGGGWGPDGLSGPQTHVHHHETLRGSLFFRCAADKIEKIRIPGLNAEWQNFKDLGQETVSDLNLNGVPGGQFAFGPHKFEVHARTRQ